MGKKHERADFSRLKNHPIAERDNKVSTADFADVEKYLRTGNITDLLPRQLKANDMRAIADCVKSARSKSRAVIFAMGAHVIKTGCSSIIIDMIKKKVITGIAMNGAGAVHDLEIAFIGATSEDVEEEVKTGRFGMVEETAAMTMEALRQYPECGFGESLGRYISDRAMKFADKSILAACVSADIPATIHASIGCEITHIHPKTDGALLGAKSFDDFKIFTAALKHLSGGGCYFNVGSAVILPEVFIKALSAARNLGDEVRDFTAVDFDMFQHYRPGVNVVHRPVTTGGKGYRVTGHHELLLPLLYHMTVGA
jgi:deoxyhypusine synthase